MKNFSQSIKSIIAALILVGGISYALAWSGPVNNPPDNGSINAPINTSSNIQAKGGTALAGSLLNVNGTLSSNSLAIFGNSIFSGTVQFSSGAAVGKVLTSNASGVASWQSPSSATTLTGGTGVTVTGGPNYTVSADYTNTQKRVTGTCSGSSVVQKINADGTVTCYTPSVSPVYCTANGKNFSPGYTCNNASQCPVNGTSVNATTCNAAGQWQSTTMYISTPYNCGTYCFN